MAAVKSILVVEEEYALRHTLSLILQRAGYQVTTVAKPWQMFIEIHNRLYDLLLIDIQTIENRLPAIIEGIQQETPESQILLLTTFDYLPPSIPSVACLNKPVSPEQVLQAIRNEIDS